MEKIKLLFYDYEYIKNTKDKYCEIFNVNSSDYTDISASNLKLSVRATNILNNMSLNTIEDILNISPSQFFHFSYCGKKTFKEINSSLLNFLKLNKEFEKTQSFIKEQEELFLFFENLSEKLIKFDFNEIKTFENIDGINIASIELCNTFEDFLLNYYSTKRRSEIIRKRFKIDYEGKCTLECIGQDYNISKERVRQIIERELNFISSRRKTPQKTKYFSLVKDLFCNLEMREIYLLFSSSHFDLYNAHYVNGLLCSLFGRKRGETIRENIKKVILNIENYKEFKKIEQQNFEESERLKSLIYFPNKKQEFRGSIKKMLPLRNIHLDNINTTGHIPLKKSYNEVPFESGCERRILKYLDANSYVTEINAQCVCIPYGDKQNYYPDIVIKTIDNTICIIEVKPYFYMPLYKNILKFEALHNYCKERNIGYLIVDDRLNSFFDYNDNICNATLENILLNELEKTHALNYFQYKELLKTNNLKVSMFELAQVVFNNKLKWKLNPFNIEK